MKSNKQKIIAIVGPTASGKTGIGVRLAKEIDGEIISADSRQVFRGLDLGTGKDGTPCSVILNPKGGPSGRSEESRRQPGAPGGRSRMRAGITALDPSAEFTLSSTLRDEPSGSDSNESLPNVPQDDSMSGCRCVDNIPQWMIDIKNPAEKFTLFDYLPMARARIEEIFSRGKTPIIVGGTGLYIQGLVEGFELKQKNVISNQPAVRQAKVRNLQINEAEDFSPCRHSMARNDINKKPHTKYQILDTMSREELAEMLMKIAPEEYKRVDIQNPHRLIRAIEKSRAGLIATKKRPNYKVLQIGIDLKRENLYKKIDDRVEERFENGMLEEIIYLLANGVKIDWMIKIGLEYRIIGRFACHHSPVPLSRENSKSEIRNPKQFNNLTIQQLGSPLSPVLAEIKEIADHLRSLPEYEAMKQELKYKIHAFARRQLAWFRRFPEIKWLDNFDEIKNESRKFLE